MKRADPLGALTGSIAARSVAEIDNRLSWLGLRARSGSCKLLDSVDNGCITSLVRLVIVDLVFLREFLGDSGGSA